MPRTLQRLAVAVVIALGIGVAALLRACAGPVPELQHHPAGSAAEPPPAAFSADPGVARPALAPVAASTTAPARPTAASLDEPALMGLLRRVAEADPSAAIELAREGNRRYPDSPDAPERASILIHSLALLGRASEARGEAEDMVNGYPDSTWVREIEAFTGAHRHRNVRLAEDGGIEFY